MRVEHRLREVKPLAQSHSQLMFDYIPETYFLKTFFFPYINLLHSPSPNTAEFILVDCGLDPVCLCILSMPMETLSYLRTKAAHFSLYGPGSNETDKSTYVAIICWIWTYHLIQIYESTRSAVNEWDAKGSGWLHLNVSTEAFGWHTTWHLMCSEIETHWIHELGAHILNQNAPTPNLLCSINVSSFH